MQVISALARVALGYARSTVPASARTALLALTLLAAGSSAVEAQKSSRPAPAAGPPAKAEILWNGRKHALDKLPADFPQQAKEAVEKWAHLSAGEGHQMALSRDGRVLLVVRRGAKPDGRLQLVERTIAETDRVLPLPPSRVAPPAREPEPEPERDASSPEDAAEPTSPRDDGYAPSTWLEDGRPLETETAVVLELGTRAQLKEVLRALEGEHPYLANYRSATFAGVTLERPLLAVWLASDAENEEWNPDNELVHRTATLLMLRRFGRQPFWLQTGFAWSVEWSVLGSLYCFPYRGEFVFAVEHTAWPSDLARQFERTPRKEYDLAELAAWKRGSFEYERAVAAFGTAAWLTGERPGALPAILEDLRVHADLHNRVPSGENSWVRDPLWEVPAAVQREIFERHAGADVWGVMTQAFRRAKTAPWARQRAR